MYEHEDVAENKIKGFYVEFFLDVQSGITVRQYFPVSWKKRFSIGVILPPKIKNCESSSKSVDESSDIWRIRAKQTDQHKAKIIEVWRRPSKEHGHMLLC